MCPTGDQRLHDAGTMLAAAVELCRRGLDGLAAEWESHERHAAREILDHAAHAMNRVIGMITETTPSPGRIIEPPPDGTGALGAAILLATSAAEHIRAVRTDPAPGTGVPGVADFLARASAELAAAVDDMLWVVGRMGHYP